MKIIGTTATGFLVDMTEDEIATAMGYRSTYDTAYRKWREGGSTYAGPKFVGRDIPLVGTPGRLREIQANEARARDCARVLKALGDMVEASLPSTMIPTTEAKPEGGGA